MQENDGLLLELIQPENQHETVALARALCPFAEAATDMMMLVCVALVEAKGDVKAVAEATGLSSSRILGHSQSRLASRIMRQLAKEKLAGVGFVKAMAALTDVVGSESQTGTARRNAAQAIVELVNAEEKATGGGEGGGIDLHAMTIGELEAYVRSLKQDMVAIPAPSPLNT